MSKSIEVGCFAEITGSKTPFDGEIVQVLFESEADKHGNPIWIISEEFPNPAGFMTDKCYGSFLKRIDGDEKELCTDWADIKFTTNWLPDKLVEVVEG